MTGLDDSRSVMEEMMALFTPPGRETKSKLKKLELHPYYKRPGRNVGLHPLVHCTSVASRKALPTPEMVSF